MSTHSTIRALGLFAIAIVMLGGCRSGNRARLALWSHPPARNASPQANGSPAYAPQTVQTVGTPSSGPDSPTNSPQTNPLNSSASADRLAEDAVPFYSAPALSTSDLGAPAYPFGRGSSSGCTKGCCPK